MSAMVLIKTTVHQTLLVQTPMEVILALVKMVLQEME